MTRARRISTTHIIMLSFLAAILLGSILLSLPISTSDGNPVPFVDALFTATTATCVTGLVVVPTVTAWSVFGQAVILLLIQLGGLGIITVMAGLAIFLQRRLGLSDRVLLQDAFNLQSLSGLVSFVKKVLLGTLLIEGLGALLYLPVFIPQFGARGIWISVFTSISAFCNAGIDVIATDSLCAYVTNPLMNIVTSALIVLGGLGYIVWWDLLRVLRERKTNKANLWRRLTLHSKIALTTTALLIVVGASLFLLFEYNNPKTLQSFSWGERIMASFFQSITTRTAGFATLPQENLSNASAILSLLLMFIGGSPVGTAGGVKTVTFAVLIAASFSAIVNRDEISLFGRSIARPIVIKSVAVCFTSFSIVFLSSLLLATTTDAPVIDLLYETVSATATVGLSRNLTGSLNTLGKLIITATMYLGRVGPISLAVAFSFRKNHSNIVKNPTESISVG